ncbi:MAG: CPBP family intramembrane glutamic endopeptidase [Candidatus Bathyarchaeia archaeon]
MIGAVDRLMYDLRGGFVKKAATFIAISYFIAFILDVLATYGLLPLMLWGFLRMWSVTISTAICLTLFKEGVSSSTWKYLKFSIKSVKLYLLSPFMVYLALGVYIAIASSVGLFDFSAYVELIAEEIVKTSGLTKEQVINLATSSAFTQIASAYLAAITVNVIFALGEEIGWRGYLYNLLGSKPTFKTTLIVGTVWGLWHASATVLLGYNYQINRLVGIVFFTVLTVLFTYPQLLLTYKAEGNVLPASSLHGAVNALWGLTVIATRLPKEFGEIVLGLGITGIITWIIIDLTFYIVVRKALSNRSPSQIAFHPLSKKETK